MVRLTRSAAIGSGGLAWQRAALQSRPPGEGNRASLRLPARPDEQRVSLSWGMDCRPDRKVRSLGRAEGRASTEWKRAGGRAQACALRPAPTAASAAAEPLQLGTRANYCAIIARNNPPRAPRSRSFAPIVAGSWVAGVSRFSRCPQSSAAWPRARARGARHWPALAQAGPPRKASFGRRGFQFLVWRLSFIAKLSIIIIDH